MLPNIDKSIRISIYQSVSSSGMLYCNLGTRCVMCSVVDKAFSNGSPHPTPPKRTLYYILLSPSKKFLPL